MLSKWSDIECVNSKFYATLKQKAEENLSWNKHVGPITSFCVAVYDFIIKWPIYFHKFRYTCSSFTIYIPIHFNAVADTKHPTPGAWHFSEQ